MKKLLFILFAVVCVSGYGQEGILKKKEKGGDDIYFIQKKSLAEMSAIADRSQADRIITCLDHFRTERQTAMALMVISGGLAIGSAKVSDEETKNGLLIAAGVSGLASLIISINSERWISRKKLTFTGNALSMRF